MYTDEQMTQEAETYVKLKSRKSDLEARLAASERVLRTGLKERRQILGIFGGYVVSVSGPRLWVKPDAKMNDKPYKKDGVPF